MSRWQKNPVKFEMGLSFKPVTLLLLINNCLVYIGEHACIIHVCTMKVLALMVKFFWFFAIMIFNPCYTIMSRPSRFMYLLFYDTCLTILPGRLILLGELWSIYFSTMNTPSFSFYPISSCIIAAGCFGV